MRTHVFLILAGALALASPAYACIHPYAPPGEQTVEIEQKGQQLLVMHAGGEETLVIRVDYQSSAPTERIGVVVPVPAVPTAYGTASPELFDQLDEWVHLHRVVQRPAIRTRGAAPPGPTSRAASVVLLPPVEAGPYRIQPIQGHGADAVEGINAWLVENEMAPIPEAALAYYAERGWTFLAVRADGAGGELARQGALPPLRIRFPTPFAVVPLRLEGQGERVPIRIYHLTREALGNDAYRGAYDRRFEVAASPDDEYLGRATPLHDGMLTADVGRFDRASAPAALRDELAEAGAALAEDDALHVRVLAHRGLGARGDDPMGWDEELTIPALPPGQRVEGATSAEPAPEAVRPEAQDAIDEMARPGGEIDGIVDEEIGPMMEGAEEPDAGAAPGACGCRVASDRHRAALASTLVPLALVLARRRRKRRSASKLTVRGRSLRVRVTQSRATSP